MWGFVRDLTWKVPFVMLATAATPLALIPAPRCMGATHSHTARHSMHTA